MAIERMRKRIQKKRVIRKEMRLVAFPMVLWCDKKRVCVRETCALLCVFKVDACGFNLGLVTGLTHNNSSKRRDTFADETCFSLRLEGV